jgi:hypothetical protein
MAEAILAAIGLITILFLCIVGLVTITDGF